MAAEEPLTPQSHPQPVVPEVDITKVDEWKDPPQISFDKQASYEVARWVLVIFAGVYLLCFIMGFVMLRFEDAKYDSALDLIKFMIGSILPLVTLAVGYYLGDKSKQSE